MGVVGCVTTPKVPVAYEDKSFDGVWSGRASPENRYSHVRGCETIRLPIFFKVKDRVATSLYTDQRLAFEAQVESGGGVRFEYPNVASNFGVSKSAVAASFWGDLGEATGRGYMTVGDGCYGVWEVEKIFPAKNSQQQMKVLLSNAAVEGFKKYQQKPFNRAFAHSATGRWYQFSNVSSKGLAKERALKQCQRLNGVHELTHPCEVVHLNGQWVRNEVTQPDEPLIGKRVRFLKSERLFAGKGYPRLEVGSGEILEIVGRFQRDDGEAILILRKERSGKMGNRLLKVVREKHEVIEK